MIDKLRNKAVVPYLLVSFILLSLLILFLPLGNIFKLSLVMILVLFLFSLYSYKIGFFLFLFTRPIIDFSASHGLFSTDSISFNLPVIFGGTMILFAIIVIIKNFKEIKSNKLIYIWLIFMLWSSLSLVYSFSVAETIKELARYSSIFLSFILAFIVIRDSRDLTRLVKVIIWSALIPSLVALYQFFTNSGLLENGDNRLFGTMTHPNMLAFYLILPVSLAVFVFLNIRKDRLEYYIYLALSLLYTFIILSTYTRGAYLALILIFLAIGFLKFKKFLLLSLIFLSIFYFVAIPFQNRVNSIFIHDSYGSIDWRINLWRDSYSFFAKRPVLGYGSGLAKEVIAKNRNFLLGASEPHNDYLKLALEGGLVSLGIYLLLIITLLIELAINYREQTKKRIKMLNLFMITITIALATMSFGDNVLNDTALQWHFWAVIGGLLAVQKNK